MKVGMQIKDDQQSYTFTRIDNVFDVVFGEISADGEDIRDCAVCEGNAKCDAEFLNIFLNIRAVFRGENRVHAFKGCETLLKGFLEKDFAELALQVGLVRGELIHILLPGFLLGCFLAGLDHGLEVEENQVVKDVLPQFLLVFHEEDLRRGLCAVEDFVEEIVEIHFKEGLFREELSQLTQVQRCDLIVRVIRNR